MDALIRPATAADAPGIGRVHMRTWQAAYRGQLPADYLDALSVERAGRGWENNIANQGPASAILVAEQDGEIAGFVACGPARDDDATPEHGEVYAIYVAAAQWRAGTGRKLNDAALETLRANGFRAATLWVLHTNARARDFYTAVGWRADGAERTEEISGQEVIEVRYTQSLS